MNYQRISILGCGWLGFPLACRLVAEDHFVRGSTTTKENIPMLEEAGIEPYYVRLDPRINGDDVVSFFDVDTVVLNIPPPRVEDRISFMLQQGEELINRLNAPSVKRLVMVSSTSVYGSGNQDADETDSHLPETENGKGLIAMEKQLMEGLKASVAVVRMAGLIGPGRNPGRFLSNRSTHGQDVAGGESNKDAANTDVKGKRAGGKNISGNGEEPVNLIHLEDAIGVVTALIRQPELTGVFNACAQNHPTRKEFYIQASSKQGFALPVFTDRAPRPWKRVISNKIRESSGYHFVYDDPIDALKDL
ncbi:MAG: hypothetical protein WD097_10325 [Balneolales bacterium]